MYFQDWSSEVTTSYSTSLKVARSIVLSVVCKHTSSRTTGVEVGRLVARPFVRLESATITHDRARPPATSRATVVRLCAI